MTDSMATPANDPSRRDAALLMNLFTDFPLAGPVSRAALVAGVLTGLARAELSEAPILVFAGESTGDFAMWLAEAYFDLVVGARPSFATLRAAPVGNARALAARLAAASRGSVVWFHRFAGGRRCLLGQQFADVVRGDTSRALILVSGAGLQLDEALRRRALVVRLDDAALAGDMRRRTLQPELPPRQLAAYTPEQRTEAALIEAERTRRRDAMLAPAWRLVAAANAPTPPGRAISTDPWVRSVSDVVPAPVWWPSPIKDWNDFLLAFGGCAMRRALTFGDIYPPGDGCTARCGWMEYVFGCPADAVVRDA